MPYKAQYYDPGHEAGYAGARRLVSVNTRGKSLESRKEEKKRVFDWLANQDAYTLHRPVRRKFPRLHYNVSNVDDVWEADLCQMTSLKDENDGYCYLLVVIDVLSKFAWVEPLRDKSARTVATAFENILRRADGRVPVYLQTDRGKEFVGSALQRLLDERGIRYRVARNPDVKAAVVERLNRTLKERMWRYFTHRNTHRYIDVIQDIVKAYNHSIHSGIRMKPVEVNLRNAARARENLAKRAQRATVARHPKYRRNDLVRISRSKGTFAKGYEKNYSEELFKVKRVSNRQGLYTYELQDLNGELIDGFFYSEELAPVGKERLSSEQTFKVERVLESRGRGAKKQFLVKWVGYPDRFNSWIRASDLRAI